MESTANLPALMQTRPIYPEKHLQTFEDSRSFLLGLSYRILGSFSDAEDVVQDVFIKWSETAIDQLDNPRAWLTTVCTRQSIDLLRAAHKSRTEYIGTWLPEPFYESAYGSHLISDDLSAEQESDETLSTAFMLLLERLSPKERAAYLLYEIFDQPYAEIARILEISAVYCRQLITRARQHISNEKSQITTLPSHRQQALLAAFQHAVQTGNLEQLSQLLTEDIQLQADGGGKVSAVAMLAGKEAVLRFFERLLFSNWSQLSWRGDTIHDGAGFICTDQQDQVNMALTFAFSSTGQISNLYVVRNPDKLKVNRHSTPPKSD